MGKLIVDSYTSEMSRVDEPRGEQHPGGTRHASSSALSDFQALVAGYQAPIFRVAYRLAGNRDDAEDLVQESLIEAFQAFDRFKPGTRFDQWIYRIMTRNYIDRFRKARKANLVSLDEVIQERETLEFADPGADPQLLLEKKAWSEPVEIALGRLSPEFRSVIVMCDVQEMSYEDASKVLGCPVGTVRSRLHRARLQLREWLQSRVGVSGENKL